MRASVGAVATPPFASRGMSGVPSVNPPTLPMPGILVSTLGRLNCRPFHRSMIQLIADRNAFLIDLDYTL